MDAIFEIIRWDDDREEIFGSGAFINTPHIASVLIEETLFANEESLEQAMQRTFQVCLHLHIPIQQHFRRIHVHNTAGHIQDDWALSDLAFYLLMLNGDVQNAIVAQAQAYAISKVFQ